MRILILALALAAALAASPAAASEEAGALTLAGLASMGSSVVVAAAAGEDDGDDDEASSSSSSSVPDGFYTREMVAEHGGDDDCWMILWSAGAGGDGGVYDLTSWIDDHPGGSSSISRNCGGEVANWNTVSLSHLMQRGTREGFLVGKVYPDQADE